MKTKHLHALPVVAAAAVGFGLMACHEPEEASFAPPPRVTVAPAPPPVAPVKKAEVSPTPSTPEEEGDGLALAHEAGCAVRHADRVTHLREEGDLEGALAEARRALHHHPGDEAVLTTVDQLARLTGSRDLRVLALDRLARVRPKDPMPLVRKARVLISLKKFDQAVEAGTKAMAVDPHHPEVYQAIGRAHLSLGELSAAIAMFQKVLSLEPDHGYALNNLGFAYLRANRNEEAVDVLTRASDLLPHVAFVLNNLGVALERTGRVDEARAAYAQASFLSPKYVKAQVNIARLAALSLADEVAAQDDEALLTE